MLIGQILGSVGLVLVLSAPFTAFLAGFGWIFLAKTILGVGFIAYYFISNRGRAKQDVGNRSTGLWIISSVTTLVFVALLVALNFIAIKNPKEFDMTREGIFTLADQTVKTLKGLKEDITVYAFYRSDEPMFEVVKDSLERYAAQTEKLKIEYVDPVKQPELTEKYQIREGGARIVFTSKMGYEGRPKDFSEQELTNALIKSTSSTLKKIYFLRGHGEIDIEDQSKQGGKVVAEALRNEGYTVEAFELTGAGVAQGQTVDLNAAGAATAKIPDDAQVVIILAPKTPLADPEVKALSDWMEKGGKVFAALNAGKVSGVEKLAAMWHVDVRNDLIVDPSSQLQNLSPAVVVTRTYEPHAITNDFRQPLAMPFSKSLAAKDGLPGAIAGVTASVIAKSGKDSWGETEFANGQARFDDKDLRGPLGIIAVASKHVAAADKVSDEGRFVISGSVQFLEATYLMMGAANGDFFINSVNWLAEEEGKISIRPKQRGMSSIALTEAQGETIKFFTLDMMPVIILALGVAVRGVRRRK